VHRVLISGRRAACLSSLATRKGERKSEEPDKVPVYRRRKSKSKKGQPASIGGCVEHL
jgi:hypothetical protein